MKIASASLHLASTHVASQEHAVRESLRAWVGPQRPDFEGRGRPPSAPPDEVRISDAAQTSLASESKKVDDDSEAGDKDPRLQLIRSMLEFLTGRRIRVFDASELHRAEPQPAPPAPAAPARANAAEPAQASGYGVEYDYHESYRESEQTSFAASGIVRTADGQEIGFALNLSLQRSFAVESDVSLRLGDAVRRKDPLVLNFSGGAAQLTEARFSFDIDSDGAADRIQFAGPGSGFLVLDRNHDGAIGNGSEMFGAGSGDGFGELAALDDDHNGWIDENDAAYRELGLWSKDAAGNDQRLSLAAAGVGAIALANAATPFDLRDNANGLVAQIRATGVFLQEDGKAGTIQQVDLTA